MEADDMSGVKVRFWPGVAQFTFISTMLFVAVMSVMTIVVNFFIDEARQPIDFYSNKIRTRPYWLILEILLLGGGLLGIFFTGRTDDLHNQLPELAIACYLQGFAIGMAQFGNLSAASSLTAMVIYAFISPCLVMVTVIPTLPLNRPGVLYGVCFFIINVIFVAWVKVGVKRHIGLDGAPKILPKGAEGLFEVWSKATFYWAPALMCLTSMAYGVEHLIYNGEYGWAMALGYTVISCLLLLGCCQKFRTGTELD